jgi:hypothetical protein
MVRLFEVEPSNLLALRARIRHIRDCGVPPIPRGGRGPAAEYSRLHVIQLAVALTLSTVGVSPKSSAAIVRATIFDGSIQDVKNEQRPSFLLLFPTGRDPAWGMRPLIAVDGHEVRMLNALVSEIGQLVLNVTSHRATNVVNLTKLVSDLDRVLQQVLEA